jgi:hypothetical protein
MTCIKKKGGTEAERVSKGALGKENRGSREHEMYGDGVCCRTSRTSRNNVSKTISNQQVNKGRTLRSLLRVPSDLSDESRRPDDVEGSDTEQLLLVVGSSSLEDFGEDGDGRVDRVRDDEDEGFGAVLGDAFGEVSAD